MGGFDDHVAMMGDWMPPNPSPRAFFSAAWGDDISSKSISESPAENNTDDKDWMRIGGAGDQSTKLNPFPDQKMNSRGGLLERMAARAGFNAPRLNTESIRPADLSLNPDVRSPYLTIPPGLSPTTLLESPVFLSNSLVQPSPTTGKILFAPSSNSRITESSDKIRSFFEDIGSSSFAFKPIAESSPSLFFGATSNQNFPSIEVSVQPENTLRCQSAEPAKVQSQSAEHSPPPDDQQDEEADQRGGGETMVGGGDSMAGGGAPSEDGYNWRKYGQKQVKGSEYPRSYYKCTHPNCPVKKKVERSHEGHITEIIYKGAHNHPKPPPNRRSVIGSSSLSSEMQLDATDQAGTQIGANGDAMWTIMQKETAGGSHDWRNGNLDVGAECSGPNSLQGQIGAHFESGDAMDGCSAFTNEEDEDDRGTHGSESLGYDGEGDESDSKRRKIEAYATEMSGATRAIREPRVVVQTTSEVDILEDGYRWRKYGQKVVKGNPNPRSYYKCTSAGCTVRKHVERASHDLKSVITTYEGKHNHDVPAARNSSHVNSGNGPAHPGASGPAHLHRPEPSQVHNNMARFDRTPVMSSFGRQQQLGPPHGFAFGMNQPGLANFAMAGLGPNQGKMPMLPVHPYLGQQRLVNEMGFMMPKGEPKVEPLSEPPLNQLPNGSSSVYSQFMSRLQM